MKMDPQMKEHLLEMLMNKVKEGKIASLTVSFEEPEEEMEEVEEEEEEKEPEGDNGGSNEEEDEEKKNIEKLKEYARK